MRVFIRRLSAVVLSALALWAANAGAVELRNDGFMAGAMVGYQGGFVAGEAGATKLSSPFTNGKLMAVRLLFGGATSVQTITLTISEDAAGNAPGAVLFTADYQLTGADSVMHELDLSGDNVQVGSAFRVAITFQHAGTPSIAADSDGITPNVNFIFVPGTGWLGSATFGLTGDWVIRALVEDNAMDGGTDAGVDAGVDAGSPDAGGPDAGVADAGTPDAGGVDAGGTDAGTSTSMCTANTDCAMGNSCDLTTRRCTFDCRAAADCGSNMTCSSLGKCVGDTKPAGCGCTSLEWAVASLVLLLVARRRRP